MGVLSVSTGGCYSIRLVFVLVTSVAGQIAVHCKIIAGCACFEGCGVMAYDIMNGMVR